MGKLSFESTLYGLRTNTIMIANLSEQRLTKEQIAEFSQALIANTSAIHVDLSNCCIIGLDQRLFICDVLVNEVSKALRTNQTIRSIDLSFTNTEYLTPLVEALRINQTLHSLDLSGNKISSDPEALIDAIEDHPALFSFKPPYNAFCNGGISYQDGDDTTEFDNKIKTMFNLKLILQGLHANSVIEIDLAGRQLSKKQIARLAKALSNNKSVTKIDLSSCNINKSDAAALAKSLQDNKTLETLIIRSNDIGLHGINSFTKTLAYNKTLQSIDCSDNKLVYTHGKDQDICNLPDWKNIEAFLKRNRKLSLHRQINWMQATIAIKVAQTKSSISTSVIPLADEITQFLGKGDSDTPKINLHKFWCSLFFRNHLLNAEEKPSIPINQNGLSLHSNTSGDHSCNP